MIERYWMKVRGIFPECGRVFATTFAVDIGDAYGPDSNVILWMSLEHILFGTLRFAKAHHSVQIWIILLAWDAMGPYLLQIRLPL